MDESRKPTDFEMSVYEATRLIPEGKVTSYGRIALQIQQGSSRSVGTALSRNPFAPEVPCHRVVRADGSLGGFYGATEGPQLIRKRAMLEKEGVQFHPNGKVETSSFMQ